MNLYITNISTVPVDVITTAGLGIFIPIYSG